MSKYLVKRVLLAILSILIVSAITFFVMNLIPGGPFNKEKATSKEAQQAVSGTVCIVYEQSAAWRLGSFTSQWKKYRNRDFQKVCSICKIRWNCGDCCHYHRCDIGQYRSTYKK